jgi:Fe-S-cluster containining protein
MGKYMKREDKIDCSECKAPSECCMTGAWLDLDEAKKILKLRIKGGDFFHLARDKKYPSGYRTSTSVGDSPCVFLTPDGLCAIHKIDYSFKPSHCKEFPYENGKLSPFVKYLCGIAKARMKKNKKKKK